MNEQRLKQIEKDITLIKSRNKRVESEKLWETSWFRRLLITAIIYIVASLLMYAIGNQQFYANSLIPALGYLLSTLSFLLIKNWWINRNS